MSDAVAPQAARQQLGAELAHLRRMSGLSGRELAAQVGFSQSTVSRVEVGATAPALPEVMRWADAVNVSAEVRERLVRLTEAALADVETYSSALHGRTHLQEQTGFYEKTARTIRNFHPAIVPGLLQTAEYTRRVLSLLMDVDASGHQQDIPAAVAGRAKRQEVLYDETRRFEFLITEAALRWHSHDHSLMVPQLDRIVSAATLRNVWIGLLPADAPVPGIAEHNFQLYDDRDDGHESVVRIELIHARLTVNDPQHVEIYQRWFARWCEQALDGDRAQEFLGRLTNEFRQG